MELFIPLEVGASPPSNFNFGKFTPFSGDDYTRSGYFHGANISISRTRLHPGIDLIPSGSDFSLYSNSEGRVYYFQAYYENSVPVVKPFNPSEENPYDKNYVNFGNYIVIESQIGSKTYYQVFAHVGKFNDEIEQGQPITPGTYLGEMGKTGAANNEIHIHWEVRREGGVRIEDGVIFFDTLSQRGFYAGNEEELDTNTVDPYIFAVILATIE